MAGFISFASNGVQPLHKGVTEIGAVRSVGSVHGVGSVEISRGFGLYQARDLGIFADPAAVKILGEINWHAGLILSG
jgi:hypothetical protein